ncbi:homoserine O-acetyltransferase MetX [Persicirhabdus sediminis]|uniref:Homoserine O-acetyltransferase n=1 Tax=Persicirhabdus sediminis TaxID=454144 RepID=A0A8J7SIN1_9BACT|nr:homoserine O-acetyltransferase [Persicirhabdus sediminis]MBK1789670.1 homoserine O-acetyltransferase [Persicirhabdus sediminis]
MFAEKQKVETQFVEFGSIDEPIVLRRGGELPGIRLAYEMWGEMNEDKSNVILLNHALSGSHHAAGFNPAIPEVGELWQPELENGWWEDFLGPGKALDTNRYCVICPNYLGGCYGTTGPASIDPRTGKEYGSNFPHLAVADQADIQARLLDALGVKRLKAAVGPSVGALITLTFATRYPDKVETVIPMCGGFKTTVYNRLILFEQILAIENDPHFNGGDYYEGTKPDYGLALARMISHKTFVHLDAIERRARSEVRQDTETLAWYKVQDTFQSYMLHQGKKFVKRFDANTYLRIIDMWSNYDAVKEGDAESPADLFKACAENNQKFLIFSIDSDFCFYPEEQAELVAHLENSGVKTMHITVHSDKGHDSFLLENEFYTPHISYALASS